MSDSDDELPRIQRTLQQKDKEAVPVAKKPAPKTVKDEDSSDDDLPLGQRKVEKPKPEKRKSPADGKQKASDGAAAKTKPAPKKAPAAKKAASGTENSTKASQGTERVRKVYAMPGQTRDTPGEEDPLRRFYTSLLEQRSDSEMARRWCAMTGLLSREDAEEWVAEQAKKKGGKSPSKQPASKRPSSAASKRKSAAASDDEADFKSAKKKKVSPAGKDTGGEKKKKVVKAPAAVKPKKEEEDAGDSEDEVIPQVKQRKSSTAAVTKPATASVPRKVPPSKRDVAFTDGGMDGSDSDDDVPLVQRMKATS